MLHSQLGMSKQLFGMSDLGMFESMFVVCGATIFHYQGLWHRKSNGLLSIGLAI